MHSLLRPPACLACGLAGAWPCCAACLPPRRGPLRPGVLGADPAVLLWSLGPYRTALREAVTAGKLRGQRAALDVLGRGLGARLAAAGVAADLVTWVPSRPWPLGPRDHAQVLAEAVAGALGLPAVHLLGVPPGPDLGRQRASGAREGVRERARPPPRRRLGGGRVLLVDDVTTSGGTLAGAAAALRAAGAAWVEAAVLAAARGAGTIPEVPETGIPAGFDPPRSV